jgi:ribosomal protein L11 methyltransferase
MNSRRVTAQSATWAASLITDEQSAHQIADLVAESFGGHDVAVTLVDAGHGRWRLAIHFRTAPDRNAVRALTAAAAGLEAGSGLRFERIAAKDWVGESLAGLRPVAAGRFVIHGLHDRSRIPINRIGIEIEAAFAFGTGHHGTTRGCLLALDRLCKTLGRGNAASRLLDLGTGSGVLAIAAARALHRQVLAIDIDASAVRIARDNAWRNRVGAVVEILQADGVTAAAIRARAPFALVFANILLKPLQCLASPLTKIIAPGGRVVLSGLLTPQASAALAAYRGLALERRIELDGWTTLVLKRGIRPRAAVARHRRGP